MLDSEALVPPGGVGGGWYVGGLRLNLTITGLGATGRRRTDQAHYGPSPESLYRLEMSLYSLYLTSHGLPLARSIVSVLRLIMTENVVFTRSPCEQMESG